jgi:hypothetical protein
MVFLRDRYRGDFLGVYGTFLQLSLRHIAEADWSGRIPEYNLKHFRLEINKRLRLDLPFAPARSFQGCGGYTRGAVHPCMYATPRTPASVCALTLPCPAFRARGMRTARTRTHSKRAPIRWGARRRRYTTPWTHYSVQFNENAGWLDEQTKTRPTASVFAEELFMLESLVVRGVYSPKRDLDTWGEGYLILLDNVTIGTGPNIMHITPNKGLAMAVTDVVLHGPIIADPAAHFACKFGAAMATTAAYLALSGALVCATPMLAAGENSVLLVIDNKVVVNETLAKTFTAHTSTDSRAEELQRKLTLLKQKKERERMMQCSADGTCAAPAEEEPPPSHSADASPVRRQRADFHPICFPLVSSAGSDSTEWLVDDDSGDAPVVPAQVIVAAGTIYCRQVDLSITKAVRTNPGRLQARISARQPTVRPSQTGPLFLVPVHASPWHRMPPQKCACACACACACVRVRA